MHAWKIVLAAAVLAAASTFTIFIFLCYLLKGIRRRSIHSRSSLKKEVLRDSALKHNNRMARVWRTACPVKPFNWSEHPALIAEAVEHGWATFAFTYSCSTCHVSSNLWDMCTGCSHGEDNEPHISWEMGSGSDYMQKIRLNPGLTMKKDNAVTAVQALQTALPLPGPPLGPLSFPQEGYYEITILAAHHEYNLDLSQNSLDDNEHEKLIHKRFQCQDRVSLDEIIDYSNEAFGKVEVTDSTDMEENGKARVKKLSGENEIELEQNVSQLEHLQILAVGLAAGATPSRLPGCYAGSVGFHSNGHLYFHGARHIQDPEVCIAKRRLRLTNGTVGCGFDPASKAVFFTFNGERVYELTTTISEFGSPLYPTIASNYDVTVLANFGQSPFAYDAANSHRVPDPCFRRPLLMAGKTGIVYEDSGDLFSMSKMDAQWLTESGSSNSHDLQHHHVLSEAESDLFEIVLEEQS